MLTHAGGIAMTRKVPPKKRGGNMGTILSNFGKSEVETTFSGIAYGLGFEIRAKIVANKSTPYAHERGNNFFSLRNLILSIFIYKFFLPMSMTFPAPGHHVSSMPKIMMILCLISLL